MVNFFVALGILSLFFVLELLYFRIALKYEIIDKPNHRSSHTALTIRGGGIIFPVAVLVGCLFLNISYSFFLLGLIIISIISFLDDLNSVNRGIRFLLHALSVYLLLMQLDVFISWYWYPVLLILIVGILNAYNFMDGINGITGGYSLIVWASLFYVNRFVYEFISENLLLSIFLSLLVFVYFNFRKKARCFAGDVGSISIAFIIIFLLAQLIIKSQNFLFLTFILVYGLDVISTIVFRIFKHENIFEAHRSHFYQYLSNEKKWPHLLVSVVYSLLQLIINFFTIKFLSSTIGFTPTILTLLSISFITFIAFILLRLRFERSTAFNKG